MYKRTSCTINIVVYHVVATTAYPEIGPLFMVSSYFRKKEHEVDGHGETAVFGPTDLDGTGGRVIWSQPVESFAETLVHNLATTINLHDGKLELEGNDD